MDEYLFLTMAKLKADRQKLEREQREAARQVGATPAPPKPGHTPKGATEFVPLLNWR
jgi:hypothetical protein